MGLSLDTKQLDRVSTIMVSNPKNEARHENSHRSEQSATVAGIIRCQGNEATAQVVELKDRPEDVREVLSHVLALDYGKCDQLFAKSPGRVYPVSFDSLYRNDTLTGNPGTRDSCHQRGSRYTQKRPSVSSGRPIFPRVQAPVDPGVGRI